MINQRTPPEPTKSVENPFPYPPISLSYTCECNSVGSPTSFILSVVAMQELNPEKTRSEIFAPLSFL